MPAALTMPSRSRGSPISARVATAAAPSLAIAAICGVMAESKWRIGERRFQRARFKGRGLPGRGVEGGGGVGITPERRDAGEPAQGARDVVGGGQFLPEDHAWEAANSSNRSRRRADRRSCRTDQAPPIASRSRLRC
jgi:hypothetical protein